MDVLAFFKRIRAERLELSRLEESRQTMRESLLPAAIRYDRDKVQTSPTDHMLETAADLSEIEGHITKLVIKLTQHIRLAYEVIEAMPTPECRELMQLRYMESDPEHFRRPMKWTDIAEIMDYSVDHVQGKLHGKAIREAREVWSRKEDKTEQVLN